MKDYMKFQIKPTKKKPWLWMQEVQEIMKIAAAQILHSLNGQHR